MNSAVVRLFVLTQALSLVMGGVVNSAVVRLFILMQALSWEV